MSDTAATGEIEDFVLDGVRELVAEPELVRRETTIEDIGIDSLDVVELGQMVQERYGTVLERRDFENVRTLGDVVDVIVEQVRRG